MISALANRVNRLERCFTLIHRERMQGLPFLNSALQVEAVDFTPWQGGGVGVLITPWFMNLMLLPGERAWGPLQVGSKMTHHFYSGSYEFTVGEEPGIGHYQLCSLFSPVQQFTDHAAAVATAREVMRGLMDSDNREGLTLHESEIRRAWQGNEGLESTERSAQEMSTLSERMECPISRREFLRGRRSRG